jgi:hypothetical protein
LGAGLDLLDSHFSDAESPDATVIRANDSARDLLHVLADHSRTAAHLTRQLPAPQAAAGTLLRQAASVAAPPGPPYQSPITAVPLHRVPERIPPRAGEDFDQATTGLNATVQRLGNAGSSGTVTS